MSRTAIVLLVLGLAAGADEASKRGPERHVLRPRLTVGQRLTGSNTISYRVTTKVREGDRETSSVEEVTRTERFLDHVLRNGSGKGIQAIVVDVTTFATLKSHLV